MSKHNFKWFFVSFFVLFFAVRPAFSQDNAPAPAASLFSGSLDVIAGVFLGGMKEYVYQGDKKITQIDWDEYGVPYLNLAGKFAWNNLFVSLDLLTSAPVKSGTTRDTDWDLSGTKTQYGEHDSYFDKHLEVLGRIGYDFSVGGKWTLSPSAGFLLRNRQWTAADGYVQYPYYGEEFSDSLPHQKVSDTVITYEELVWFPQISLDTVFAPTEWLSFKLKASYYPYVHVETIDCHFMYLRQYFDIMQGMGGLVELSVAYSPPRLAGISFSISGGYELIRTKKGETSEGVLGLDNLGLVRDTGYSSMSASDLGWITLGVNLYPEIIWR
ncbi:MAG: omptin family outer membrane protease [Treponema sp.]|jgi:outer membrane protease|nr:omptin family outer membrane protease [Treponema sp.]